MARMHPEDIEGLESPTEWNGGRLFRECRKK
jgi:hypothetical protein